MAKARRIGKNYKIAWISFDNVFPCRDRFQSACCWRLWPPSPSGRRNPVKMVRKIATAKSPKHNFTHTKLKKISMIPDLPTLYDYFTEGGVSEGLRADKRSSFTLNGLDLTLFSGSLHYFRVHPAQWRDRLRKYRAAGLNAIDVYVPWNLHNPERGVFDFGGGGRDFSEFLDLPAFLAMAREEDLFVIFRPGPYICAEWEFGGMPR